MAICCSRSRQTIQSFRKCMHKDEEGIEGGRGRPQYPPKAIKSLQILFRQQRLKRFVRLVIAKMAHVEVDTVFEFLCSCGAYVDNMFEQPGDLLSLFILETRLCIFRVDQGLFLSL